ncbi:Rha family transcriptional regulator [Streptococcus intermedius]|uniref:Rha family transcriptional regulator n=1 Tax=Streptococcus intermedius TaxID=1338 RepID=UPI002F3EE9CA
MQRYNITQLHGQSERTLNALNGSERLDLKSKLQRVDKDYILNEQQATLLITFLKNTEQVANFKENLVKAFFEMRDELTQFKLQCALEKPKRKTLHDSIESWKEAPKHPHSTITNLLLKGTSGMNKKQLVAARGGATGIDSLTSEELVKYQALEDMVIAIINLGMSYQDIRTMVFRPKERS